MRNKILRTALFALIACGIAAAAVFREEIHADKIQSQLETAGAAGPVLFMIFFAAATVLFIPGSVFALLGGALFGPVFGTIYNLSSSTLGAMAAFLISRFIASDWVEKKSGGILKKLIQGVEKEGWKFVAFVRLVPLFPFNLLNYSLGLTKISFVQYSAATFIFMAPGAIAYTYLGYAGREAVAGGEDLVQKILLALALLAAAAFLPGFILKLRRKPMISTAELKDIINRKEEYLLLDVRTENDYNGEQGHIKESRLVPLEELESRIDELNVYTEIPVYTICRTDKKSSKAAAILAKKGFAHVRVVKGGMTSWNEL